MAQSWGLVMTPTRPLNVRTDRSPDAGRVTTIMPGRKVRADFHRDGWYAVFEMDVTERDQAKALGYCRDKYLKVVDGGSGSDWGKIRTPQGMLNIRQGRSPKSDHVMTLKPGDLVKVDFAKDGWVAVFKADEIVREEKRALGYSNAKYLHPPTTEQMAAWSRKNASAAAPAPETEPKELTSERTELIPEPRPEPKPERKELIPEPESVVAAKSGSGGIDWGALVALSRRINLRKERTAASKLITVLKPGRVVRVDFAKRGWYAVFDPAQPDRSEAKALGYLYAPLIEKDLPAPPPAPAVVEPDKPEQARDDAEPMHQVRAQATNLTPIQANPELPRTELEPEPDANAAMPGPEEAAESGTKLPDEPGLKEMTISPREEGGEPHRGPMPVADQQRHGYHFKILDHMEQPAGMHRQVTLRVFLAVTVIPRSDSLRDFCDTLWREYWKQGEILLIDVYLPGQDLRDLSYAQAKCDGQGVRELWTREAVLYGTRLQPE